MKRKTLKTLFNHYNTVCFDDMLPNCVDFYEFSAKEARRVYPDMEIDGTILKAQDGLSYMIGIARELKGIDRISTLLHEMIHLKHYEHGPVHEEHGAKFRADALEVAEMLTKNEIEKISLFFLIVGAT